MRTRIEVGVPKFNTRPPTTVKPPTESGNPASPLTDLETYTDNGSTDTHDWKIPSGVVAGDGILVCVYSYNKNLINSTPSGYTEVLETNDGSSQAVIYWKVADGTETSSTFTTTSSTGEIAAVFGRVPSNGATLSAPETSAFLDDATIDPPAVNPADTPDTYHVVVFMGINKGGPTAGTAPSGYTNLVDLVSSGAVLNAQVHLAQKASTSIASQEDPGVWAISTSAGSRYYRTATIAIKAAANTPSVVGYPVTASDIDSEASTDGQVITSDGAGGAAWEDAPGDADAIHDNVAAEISAITAKGSPVSGDYLLIEDSEDSDNKKSITIGDLPTGATDHGALTGLTDDDHTQYLNVARHDADDHSGLSLAASDLTTRYEVIVYDDGSGLEAVANEAGTDWLYTEV